MALQAVAFSYNGLRPTPPPGPPHRHHRATSTDEGSTRCSSIARLPRRRSIAAQPRVLQVTGAMSFPRFRRPSGNTGVTPTSGWKSIDGGKTREKVATFHWFSSRRVSSLHCWYIQRGTLSISNKDSTPGCCMSSPRCRHGSLWLTSTEAAFVGR